MQTIDSIRFEVGRIYNRRSDIHGSYGGQEQGGMATPRRFPVIFLFTADSGHVHGYRDAYREDGVFCYTGEGQLGDMSMTGSNKALRDHELSKKAVHLFEASESIGKGKVRYMGEATYLGHHLEERPDTSGASRMAIVFELAVDSTGLNISVSQEVEESAYTSTTAKQIDKLSLAQLRQLATVQSSQGATAQQRVTLVRKRSRAIRTYVLKRANGICEGCDEEAPFHTKTKQAYLEPHHTLRLADGGPDAPEHVIALCPNCHRRAHYADDSTAYNLSLIEKLVILESTAK
jgi:5-methylcytosine-specific restriction protein A